MSFPSSILSESCQKKHCTHIHVTFPHIRLRKMLKRGYFSSKSAHPYKKKTTAYISLSVLLVNSEASALLWVVLVLQSAWKVVLDWEKSG